MDSSGLEEEKTPAPANVTPCLRNVVEVGVLKIGPCRRAWVLGSLIGMNGNSGQSCK